jgi:uncharacterized RDD family membrane protein YckC
MQTITVHTTQNIDIDYEIAGLGERILARMIDYGIFIALYFFAIFVAAISMSEIGFAVVLIFTAVLFVFYDLVCEVFLNGQSIGKRIMKIKVISLNGNRPTFGQYLIRWVMRLVDFGITLNIGALVSAIVTENGQRIGDIAAGTAMIKTHPRTQMNNLVFTPSEDGYVPVFTEVSQLNDSDVGLIADVLHNYIKTRNSVIVFNMAQRIKDHLSISILQPEMNDLKFLQTIIKDYSHISAQTESL